MRISRVYTRISRVRACTVICTPTNLRMRNATYCRGDYTHTHKQCWIQQWQFFTCWGLGDQWCIVYVGMLVFVIMRVAAYFSHQCCIYDDWVPPRVCTLVLFIITGIVEKVRKQAWILVYITLCAYVILLYTAWTLVTGYAHSTLCNLVTIWSLYICPYSSSQQDRKLWNSWTEGTYFTTLELCSYNKPTPMYSVKEQT